MRSSLRCSPLRLLGCGALGLGLVAGCGTPPPGPEDPGDVVVWQLASLLETPAASGSAEPNLVSGEDGRLYLSWIETHTEGHALRFSTWEHDAWSAPRTIAAGADWFVNWADFPSMAALADGTLAAHWLVKSAQETYAYDVVLAVSSDGGHSWSEPVRPHRDGTATEHGFVSLLADPDGFLVVWLDGRQMANEPPGPMTLRQAVLARDGSVGPSRILDASVCDCCPTDASRIEDGALVVYRDRAAGEVRDVFSVRLEAATWSTPAAVHDDGWVIGGCPVNGPALDSAGNDVAVAWFTAADGDPGAALVAFSDDGGRSFGPAVRVDEGRPLGRVDVTLLDGSQALVSWVEQLEGSAAFKVRLLERDGSSSAAFTLAAISLSRQAGFPKTVRHKNEVFTAWTETGDPSRVRTARLPDLVEYQRAGKTARLDSPVGQFWSIARKSSSSF